MLSMWFLRLLRHSEDLVCACSKSDTLFLQEWVLAELVTALQEPHSTLDAEEAGAKIIIKYAQRKQEWQQRRVGRKTILPVCQEMEEERFHTLTSKGHRTM